MNDVSHILKNFIEGDEKNYSRLKNLDFVELSSGLELLLNNPNLSSLSKRYLLENKWKINYKVKPPTIEEFLTREWIGDIADGIYPYIKETLIEFFNPLNDYRNLMLSSFIGYGKSFLAVLSNLFITVNLWCMRNPKKYFGLNQATTLVQLLISFTEEKAKEVLLDPFKNILSVSPKFIRCRTEDSLLKKQKEFENNKICYTTAGVFALQFTNNINYKIASNPAKLLGVTAVSATLSELSYFIERGFSYDSIWRIFQDSKTRVFSRLKHHYLARVFLDSSPMDCSLSPLDAYVFNGEADKPDSEGKYRNYVITGAMWEYKKWEFKNLDQTFSIFVGNEGQPAKIIENKQDIVKYHPENLIHPPVELKSLFEEDLVRNIRNLGGRPSSSPSKLITNYTYIDKIFNDSNLKNIEWGIKAPANLSPEKLIWDQLKDEFFIRINGRYQFYRNSKEIRYLHIDQSEVNDATGISCGHVELTKKGEKIYIMDFTLAIIPDSNRINLDAISEFIFDLKKEGHMKLGLVTFDGYQSSSVIQRLKRRNINCNKLSVDSDMSPYKLLVSLIYNEKFKSGKNIILKNNLKSLQEVRTEKGRRKIDHLRGKSVREYDGNFKMSVCGINEKDLSDSVAGVVYHCINEYKGNPRYIYEPNSFTNTNSLLEIIKNQHNLVPKR